MRRLFSSAHIVAVLENHHFFFVSQRGSHMKYRKNTDEMALTVIVPADRKEIPLGTFRSILRQSHLRIEDFQ